MTDTARQLTYKRFLEGADNNQLLGMRCNDCSAVTFPPKAVCMECSSGNYQIVELNGKGIVKTFTVIRVPPEGFEGVYMVGLVQLLEGPNIMVNIKTNRQPAMDIIGQKGTVACSLLPGDKYSGGRRVTFSLFLED